MLVQSPTTRTVSTRRSRRVMSTSVPKKPEERADRRGGVDGELVIRENDAERLRRRLIDERDAVIDERKDDDHVAQGTCLGTPRGHVLVECGGELGDRGGIAGEGMGLALD